LTIKKQGKAQFCFEKSKERKFFEGKRLNKHLSIANKRQITGDKKKQLKEIKID
jgi:hypothetical protein